MRGDVKMEEIFVTRIKELDLEENEKDIILNNTKIFAKIYWQAIKDLTLNINSDN